MTDEETATASDRANAAATGLRRRYGLLLLVLIATYLLAAFFSAIWVSNTQLGLFIVVAMLTVRNSVIRRGSQRPAIWVALGTSVLAIVIGVALGTNTSRGAASLWIGLLLLATVALLIDQIMQMPAVTIQSIYGAISAYLVIGLMFSVFYSAMYYLGGGNFFAQGRQFHSPSDFQYFSFSTLTTLGYGDFTAKLSAGRAVAMLEAMAGQIFLATLVAKLVASFRPASRPARNRTAQLPGADD